MTDVSLAGILIPGVLVQRIAKTLVIAWLNYTIAIHDVAPVMMWFEPDEFGQVFKELGWDEGGRVAVEIKLEEKCQIEIVQEYELIKSMPYGTGLGLSFQLEKGEHCRYFAHSDTYLFESRQGVIPFFNRESVKDGIDYFRPVK